MLRSTISFNNSFLSSNITTPLKNVAGKLLAKVQHQAVKVASVAKTGIFHEQTKRRINDSQDILKQNQIVRQNLVKEIEKADDSQNQSRVNLLLLNSAMPERKIVLKEFEDRGEIVTNLKAQLDRVDALSKKEQRFVDETMAKQDQFANGIYNFGKLIAGVAFVNSLYSRQDQNDPNQIDRALFPKIN